MSALVALSGGALVAACAVLGRVPNLALAPGTFLALFTVAFVCYAAGAWLLRDARGTAVTVVVLAIAALTRLALLPAAPSLSTDAYRYLWDARVARAGISPYAYPPDAPELAALRDQHIFPRLNHPTWRTIYPPAAQLFWSAVGRVAPDSMLALKVALGIAELAALGTLLGLLRALDLPEGRLVIYAWNPLLLVEVWGTAHLDALVLPAVVGATWAFVAQRRALGAALLAAGASIKLYPAALLPLILGGAGSATALGAGRGCRRARLAPALPSRGVLQPRHHALAGRQPVPRHRRSPRVGRLGRHHSPDGVAPPSRGDVRGRTDRAERQRLPLVRVVAHPLPDPGTLDTVDRLHG